MSPKGFVLSLTPPLRAPWLYVRTNVRECRIGSRMRQAVRALTRQNLIAIAVGALLAGASLLAFNLWIGHLVDAEGRRAIDNAAQRAVSVANARLSQALAALDDLSDQ